MKVSNRPIGGKRIGPAKDVSVRVKFEHDTGLDAACAAPTAWLHEKFGSVNLKVGDEKEAIIAVRSGRDWYTVTNVRDSSGDPTNTSAMRFQDAPWFQGNLHIGLIVDGEIIEQHYSWQVTEESIFPRIRKISAVQDRLTKEEFALPALRPKVVPVRWGQTPDRRFGLFVRNDGEPAFDLSLEEPVSIGTAKLEFWERVYPGLTKADGEFFIDSWIELSHGAGTTGSALRDEMLKANLDAVTLKIRYRDIDNQGWVTLFELVRDFWGTGLRVSSVRQELAPAGGLMITTSQRV